MGPTSIILSQGPRPDLFRAMIDAIANTYQASTIFLRPVLFTAATNFSSSHEFMLRRSIGV